MIQLNTYASTPTTSLQNQILLQNAASIVEKFDVCLPIETKEQTLQLVAIGNGKLTNVSKREKTDTIEPVIKKEELDLDEVPDEEAEERQRRIEKNKAREKEKLKRRAAQVTEKLLSDIYASMKDEVTVSEGPVTLGNDSLAMSVVIQTLSQSGCNMTSSSGFASVRIPPVNNNQVAKIMMALLAVNVFSIPESSRDVDSHVVHMYLEGENTTSPGTFVVPELIVSLRQNKNLSEVDVVNATALAGHGMIYLKLTVDTAASALLLQLNEKTTQRWQVGTAAVN
ncbi:hypothetical protein LSAT2_010857 [Lamellibrachia satsuma]|nr:hypothetical protein LSAT2_010857 [Lamellibrachia satsuma]